MCQPAHIFIYLTTQFPHLSFSSLVNFNDLILFKLATPSQHLHSPQSIFYIMFEILHFRCDFEDKEVHACLLADLILLMLSCFACQSVLQSIPHFPFLIPFIIFTRLCVIASLVLPPQLNLFASPRICIKLSFQVSFVYFLSLCCPQSTYLSTRFFHLCTFHINAQCNIIYKFVSYLTIPP